MTMILIRSHNKLYIVLVGIVLWQFHHRIHPWHSRTLTTTQIL
jgi:hypothetical protein